MAIDAINSQNPYLQKLGMLTVQPKVAPPTQVAGAPIAAGYVSGEDGMTQVAQGNYQGVGFGPILDAGAGTHYTNGSGHGVHTKWFVG